MGMPQRNYHKRMATRGRAPKRRRKLLPLLCLLALATVFWGKLPLPQPQSQRNLPQGVSVQTYSPDDPQEQEERAGAQEDLPAGAQISESVLPQGPAGPVSANISPITIQGDNGSYPGSGMVYYKNATEYAVDIPALLAQKTNIAISAKKPAVLIVHTHGTEAYTPDSANWYPPTDTDRTTDPNYNVVRVGAEIDRVLKEKGIMTVHKTVLNDSPSYNGAYNRTLDVISQAMKENPSIKFVIDVHRDAMITSSGTKYKTVAQINGRQAAQLMLVAGTDAGGLTHESWRENLAFMCKVQDKMNTLYPGIMRPIDLRAARFNQHVTTGSMLLEVGTSGNSLDEALYSAGLFADALGDMLLKLQK